MPPYLPTFAAAYPTSRSMGGPGTDTAAVPQVALKLLRMYGQAAQETQDSFFSVRANAPISSLRMEIPTLILRVGESASGFSESCSSYYDSAQLTGRAHVSRVAWQATSPSTYPSHFTLNFSVICLIPKLGAETFPIWFALLGPPVWFSHIAFLRPGFS